MATYLTLDKEFQGTLSHSIDDFPGGIVVVADKPYRWTSADVIRKVKYAAIHHFGKKNLKVGHAGTLDPLATGVLLVCIGNACKCASEIQAGDKEYLAELCFGATTPSYDREKEIDKFYPTDGVSEAALKRVLPSFMGEQDQVAPLFSAKQTDGRRAYELARKLLKEGKTPEEIDAAAKDVLNVNRINIHSIELLSFGLSLSSANETAEGASGRINVAAIPEGLPQAVISVACSKGTYIRSIARDLGESLNSGAFLSNLRRTGSGGFNAASALSVDDILERLD